MTTKHTYFAARTSRELVQHLEGFHNDWRQTVGSQSGAGGLSRIWARNLVLFYANLFEGSDDTTLSFMGEQGELVRMLVPEARSIFTEFLSLTTKQKLNFEASTDSTSSKTIANTSFSAALIQHILMAEKLDSKGRNMAELGGLMGTSYLSAVWDMTRGRKAAADPDTGEASYTGNNRIKVHTADDVFYDFRRDDFYESPWVEVRDLVNRFDMIAMAPHLEAEILAVKPARESKDGIMLFDGGDTDDLIYCYWFWHRSTPAMEDGRHTVYLSEKAIIFDDVNPYTCWDGTYIPVSQFKPEPVHKSGFGYPIFSNLLPLQEMLDHNMSAQATNNAALAVKTILNPTGNDISVKNIGSMRFLSYTPQNNPSGGRPETLDLNTPNAELDRFNDRIMRHMQQIGKVNSALRGEPPAGVTSGTAIATLSSNAIEFAQTFSAAYVEALETTITHSVWNYHNFASEEFLADVLGRKDAFTAKRFKMSTLGEIRRIKAQVANPLMASAAGRFEVANQLAAQGMVKSMNRYFKILEGAPVKELYEMEFNQDQFIEEEIEELMKGPDEAPRDVPVLATDDHPAHLMRQLPLLDSIEIRNDPFKRQRIEAHIQKHFEEAMKVDPAFYHMMKTGTLPQMAPPPPPAPGGGGKGPMPPPPGGGGGGAQPALPAEPPADLGNDDLGGMAPPLPLG